MRMTMTATLLAVSAAGAAQAQLPLINATCPTGIDVHVDQGGPVYINGKEAKLTTSNDNFYEARHGHTAIDIMINPDKSVSVSYTGQGGANGECQVSDSGGSGAGGCPADLSEADRYKYPACD